MVRCINGEKNPIIEKIEKDSKRFRWKILYVLFQLLYLFFHSINLIFYWGKGKTVPPVKNNLLLMSATKIAAEIRNGNVKSEEVIQAYIDRIVEVEGIINAVAEYRFRGAVREAKEVDDLIKSKQYSTEHLEKEKPLLGVPLTVKVLLNVKGLRNTAGSLIFKDSPVASEDAPTVADLKEAGAIVLVTSNSTELGFGYDAINCMYGKTCNPYDTHRTAGGSSGGEGALIGSGASVIGLGNDLFGSVRFPAAVNGIFAHKPTDGLLKSNVGSRPIITEKISSFLTTGPMCRYADDLVTMMQVLTSKNPEKLDFGRPVDFKTIKIFYQFDLEDQYSVPVDMEIKAAILKAINYFSVNYGVVAEEVNIKLLSLVNTITVPILINGIPNLVKHCSEGKLKHFNGYLELLKYPFGLSKHSLWFIYYSITSCSQLLCEPHKDSQGRTMLKQLDHIFDDLLNNNSIFIYPSLPQPVPRPYEMIPRIYTGTYMGIFNFLGYPVTQCPLGHDSNSLPQGVQIVAKKNNDPLTIACAQELSRVFGGWIPPS